MAKKYFKHEKYCRWDLYRAFGRNLSSDMQENIQFLLPILENISDEDIYTIASDKVDFSAMMPNESIPGEIAWRAFAYEQEQQALPNFPLSFDHALQYVKKIYQ
ncbi:MAG: hypothetical protein ACHP9Y_03365 [Gammaproteobacteria bacterium]